VRREEVTARARQRGRQLPGVPQRCAQWDDCASTRLRPSGWLAGPGRRVETGRRHGQAPAAGTGSGPSGGPYHLRDWGWSPAALPGRAVPIVYDGAEFRKADDRRCPGTTCCGDDCRKMTNFGHVAQDGRPSEPGAPLARARARAGAKASARPGATGPRRYRAKLNVMPQWAGSGSVTKNWRYTDPGNGTRPGQQGTSSGTGCSPSGGRPVRRPASSTRCLHLRTRGLAQGAVRDLRCGGHPGITVRPGCQQGYTWADAFTGRRGGL